METATTKSLSKVILINPRNYFSQGKLRPPFGLLTIASSFRNLGVSVVWVDADTELDHDKVFDQIREHKDADLIATGGMHTAYNHVQGVFETLNNDEELRDIPTLIGGRIAKDVGHVLWEKIPNIDMLCRQEGEYVVEDLVEHFPELQLVRGLEYREERSCSARVKVNDAAPVIQKSEEFLPISYDLLEDEYFSTQSNVGTIVTARGCPFKCHFCRLDDDVRETYRPMPTEMVFDNIEYLTKQRGCTKIYIVDELFFQNKKRIFEICERIKPLGVKWQVSGRGDSIKETDGALLTALKEAGCKTIMMGIESGSQTQLKNMNKKLRLDRAEKGIAMVRSHGIYVAPAFIYGFPGETRETMIESAKWRRKMNFPGGFFYATPYPGSELYRQWKQEFSISIDDEEAWLLKNPGIKRVGLMDKSKKDSKLWSFFKGSNRKLPREHPNFTSMPSWKWRLTALEYMMRLNTTYWILFEMARHPISKGRALLPVLLTPVRHREQRIRTQQEGELY